MYDVFAQFQQHALRGKTGRFGIAQTESSETSSAVWMGRRTLATDVAVLVLKSSNRQSCMTLREHHTLSVNPLKTGVPKVGVLS
jgi:hypothetical protein